MKGPYERLKYDLRRVWECPACSRQLRSSGAVTAMVCSCQIQQPLVTQITMKLVHDGPLLVDAAAHHAAVPHSTAPH